MPKQQAQKPVYICAECGYETVRWLGRCPSCMSYSSMELTEQAAPPRQTPKARLGPAGPGAPSTLSNIDGDAGQRTPTGIGELDGVLSGGVVDGSLILVGGDPGIGKSTLLLQICQNLGKSGKRTLYVSGEESAGQIKLRARRLGVDTENLLLYTETRMERVIEAAREAAPDFAVIDSIQTVYMEESGSAPGSVTQIRECASALMRFCKETGTAVWIVGHVTKEGSLAGPKVLEHMVDTVLYFEGDKRENCRIIRAVKNRFGGTDEIGVFEMRRDGLAEINSPSEYMLSGRPTDAPGSVVTCAVEGTRPILTEVQALVGHTSFGMPRRTATGLDYNRVVMLIAVLEKRAGLNLSNFDSYVNIAGGVKVTEPSIDAAVVLAVASSYKNVPADPQTVVFGEVGLTGELRSVANAEKRIAEARKLGFAACLLPRANMKGIKRPDGIRILGCVNVVELLNAGLIKGKGAGDD